MPWHIEEQDGEFCVIKDGDGTNEGCHATRGEAMDQVRALYAADAAAGGSADAATQGTPFTALLAVEGLATADRRYFEVASVTWRDLPLPLMVQDTLPEFGGHSGAWFAGAIQRIERDPVEPTRIMGYGHLATGAPGERAAELIRAGLQGVSVDASASDVHLDVRAWDDTGMPSDWLERYADARLMGATVTPHPAFEEAVVWLDGMPEPDRVQAAHGEDLPVVDAPPPASEGDAALLALYASGAADARPPRAAFFVPEPDGPMPLTVTDDGRVFGHVAEWGQCHIGFSNRCVSPPASPSDYAWFHLKQVVTADGETVACGTLTMGTGHASTERDTTAAQALAHYDHTGTAVADVRVVNGVYGPWACGVVRPGLAVERVDALRAAAWSGDWRNVDGSGLDLVALLAVNVPGFPIRRTEAVVAGGALVALVAAPAPQPTGPCLTCGESPEEPVDGPLLDALREVVAEVRALRSAVTVAFSDRFDEAAERLALRLGGR